MSHWVEFFKVDGNGNDFLFVDDLDGRLSSRFDLPELAVRACGRRTSVGADGLLVMGWDRGVYRMRIFNADGSEADMCGNGARCFAMILRWLGLEDPEMEFLTNVGPVRAHVHRDSTVSLHMGLNPFGEGALFRVSERVGEVEAEMWYLHVGVPHLVLWADRWDLSEDGFRSLGARYRHDPRFPRGTNVNFVSPSEGGLTCVTYERGVEDLTLSCGTGACAVAASAVMRGMGSPVRVESPGGYNLVEVELEDQGARYRLRGPVRVSARGVLYVG